MNTVEILINTNASSEEKENLSIPQEAVEEFLNEGFIENIYDGKVSYMCMPRAVNPDFMQILLYIVDVTDLVVNLGVIISAIVKFFKQCKGYEAIITIEAESDNKKVEIDIPLEADCDINQMVNDIMYKI